jgi:hypothetical protein
MLNNINETFISETEVPLEIMKYYKNKISLLSLYLLSTFDAINSAFIEFEKILNNIPQSNNMIFNNINNFNSNIITNNNISNNNNKKNRSDNSITANNDSISTDDKNEDLLDNFKEIYKKKNKIGKYHWKIRAIKILRYKIKQIIRQGKCPVITKYIGRSKIASKKPRLHGRFIKTK